MKTLSWWTCCCSLFCVEGEGGIFPAKVGASGSAKEEIDGIFLMCGLGFEKSVIERVQLSFVMYLLMLWLPVETMRL